MTPRNTLSLIALATVLAACGGGGGGTDAPTAGAASAQWATTSIDFGGSSVGATTLRDVDVTNTGTASGNFSQFSGLPDGVTAEGCSSVAAGASCRVTLAYAPKKTGVASGTVSVTGAAQSTGIQVAGTGVESALQAISLHRTSEKSSWKGVLPFEGINRVAMVLKEVQDVPPKDGAPGYCSVTLQGSYPAELAGRTLEVGTWAFRIPAEGSVSTAGNTTTTTFRQERRDLMCWTAAGAVESYSRVLMY